MKTRYFKCMCGGMVLAALSVFAAGALAADLDPARFTYTPKLTQLSTQPFNAFVTIAEHANITGATFNYKPTGAAAYTSKAMKRGSSYYSASLTASELTSDGFAYYFEATYKDGKVYRSKDYYVVVIYASFEPAPVSYYDDAAGTSVPVAAREIVLKLDPAVDPTALARTINDLVVIHHAQVLEIDNANGLVRLRAPATADLKSALDGYRAQTTVDVAQPNALYKHVLVPNDPSLANQWAVNTLRLKEAWDITTGDAGVLIAIIDSGRDAAHVDLTGQFLPGYDYYANDGRPDDEHGHGTMVSGVISAIGNNKKGIAGANWQSKIIPYRAGNGYFSSWAIVRSIHAAVAAGARVINMSFGSGAAMPLEHDAIKFAATKNIVLVAAAGNDGTQNHHYPAAYPEVIAVAASTNMDQRAAFSTHGDWIDVAAPGKTIYTTIRNNRYTSVDGTSFAAPYAAGVASLMLSANPDLTREQVRDLLRSTAVDLGAPGFDAEFGHGRIDAYAAVRAAREAAIDETAPLIVHAPIEEAEAGVSIPVAADITDNVSVARAFVLYRRAGQSDFTRVDMRMLGGSRYEGVIPKDVMAPDGIDYVVGAADPKGNEARTPVRWMRMTDLAAPMVQHTRPAEAREGEPLAISSVITDNVAVTRAAIFARPDGGAYQEIPMTAGVAGLYTAMIPATIVRQPAVEYYFDATDGAGNAPAMGAAADSAAPHRIPVVFVDARPPHCEHAAIGRSQEPNHAFQIAAIVRDDVKLDTVSLYYQAPGSSEFTGLSMRALGGDSFATYIPAAAMVPGEVHYFIDAKDAAGNRPPSGTGGSSAAMLSIFIPLHDTPPLIVHEAAGQPPEELIEGIPAKLSAVIVDQKTVTDVRLSYKSTDMPAFINRTMTFSSAHADGNRYEATLRAENVVAPSMEYSLWAENIYRNDTTWGPVTVPVHAKIGVPTPDGDTGAFWIPTARILLYRDRTSGALLRMNVPGFDSASFAWSPDLAKLIMTGSWADSVSAFVISFGESVPVAYRITTSDAQELFPSWSADGKYILFASNRNGDWDLFMKEWDGDGDGVPDATGKEIQISDDDDFVGHHSGELLGFGQLSNPNTNDVVRGRVILTGSAFAILRADGFTQVPAESYHFTIDGSRGPFIGSTLESDSLVNILYDADLGVWDASTFAPGRHQICLHVIGNRGTPESLDGVDCKNVWVAGLKADVSLNPDPVWTDAGMTRASGGVTYVQGTPGAFLPVALSMAGRADTWTATTDGSGKYELALPVPTAPGFYPVTAVATDSSGLTAQAFDTLEVRVNAIGIGLALAPAETYPLLDVIASGRLAYARGEAAVNREVAVEVLETGKRYFDLTDAAGAYRVTMRAPVEPGDYTVRASGGDGRDTSVASAALKVLVPPIAVSEVIDPRVTFTGEYSSVSGTAVYTLTGEPLVNADVRIDVPSAGAPAAASVRTDTQGRYVALLRAPLKAGVYPVDVRATDGRATAANQKEWTVLAPPAGPGAPVEPGVPAELEVTLSASPNEVWRGRKTELSGEVRYVYNGYRWTPDTAVVTLSIDNDGRAWTVNVGLSDLGRFRQMIDAPTLVGSYIVRAAASEKYSLRAETEAALLVKDRPIVMQSSVRLPAFYRSIRNNSMAVTALYADGPAVPRGTAIRAVSSPAGLDMNSVTINDTGLSLFLFSNPDSHGLYTLHLLATDVYGNTGAASDTLLALRLSLDLESAVNPDSTPALEPDAPRIRGRVSYIQTGRNVVNAALDIASVPGGFQHHSTTDFDGYFSITAQYNELGPYETYTVTVSDGVESASATHLLKVIYKPLDVKAWMNNPSDMFPAITVRQFRSNGDSVTNAGSVSAQVRSRATGRVAWEGRTDAKGLPGSRPEVEYYLALDKLDPDTYDVTIEASDLYGRGDTSFTVAVEARPAEAPLPELPPIQPPDDSPVAVYPFPPTPPQAPEEPSLDPAPAPPDTPVQPPLRIVVTAPRLIIQSPGLPVTIDGRAEYTNGAGPLWPGDAELEPSSGGASFGKVLTGAGGEFRLPEFAAPASPADYRVIASDGRRRGEAIVRVEPPAQAAAPWTPLPAPDPAWDELYPVMSPDGNYIAYSRKPAGSDQKLNLAIRTLTTPPQVIAFTNELGGDMYPAWSPDGKSIAFGSRRDGDYEIWVKQVDGNGDGMPDASGRLRQVTDHWSDDNKPTWSPDGARIAFHSDRAGNFDIWAQNSDGLGDAERLTWRTALDANPHWSSDGKWIVFHSNRLGRVDPQSQAQTGVARVGIVMDESGSIDPDEFATMTSAMNRFVNNLPAATPIYANKFASRVGDALEFTTDRERVKTFIGERKMTGATAMVDGAFAAVVQMIMQSERQKVVVVVTDGYDNASSWTAADVVRMANQQGVIIYGVAVSDGTGTPRPALERMVTGTGGQIFEVEDFAGIEDGLQAVLMSFNRLMVNFDIWYMPASGEKTAPAKQLTDHVADDLFPAFSPDVSKIAFASYRSGRGDIYVILFDPNTETVRPAWPPRAVCSMDSELTTVNLNVTFDASGSSDSDGSIVDYLWHFGDGDTAAGITAVHAYASAGTYAVSLAVRDNDGLQGRSMCELAVLPAPEPPEETRPIVPEPPEETRPIAPEPPEETQPIAPEPPPETQPVVNPQPVPPAVDSAPPVAICHADTDVVAQPHSQVHFDASASFDTDGRIVSYCWSVVEGLIIPGACLETADPFFSHLFEFPGSQTVTLRVTDDDGLVDTSFCEVVVLPGPPIPEPEPPVVRPADTLPPVAVCVVDTDRTRPGREVTFDGSRSYDTDGRIRMYEWLFGDGGMSSESVVTHMYSSPGRYEATLTVTDSDGLVDSSVCVIAVQPVPVEAALPGLCNLRMDTYQHVYASARPSQKHISGRAAIAYEDGEFRARVGVFADLTGGGYSDAGEIRSPDGLLWSEPLDLTNRFPGAPRIFNSGTVIWERIVGRTDFFASTRDGDIVYASYREPGGWSEPVVIHTDPYLNIYGNENLEFVPGPDGNTALLYYVAVDHTYPFYSAGARLHMLTMVKVLTLAWDNERGTWESVGSCVAVHPVAASLHPDTGDIMIHGVSASRRSDGSYDMYFVLQVPQVIAPDQWWKFADTTVVYRAQSGDGYRWSNFTRIMGSSDLAYPDTFIVSVEPVTLPGDPTNYLYAVLTGEYDVKAPRLARFLVSCGERSLEPEPNPAPVPAPVPQPPVAVAAVDSNYAQAECCGGNGSHGGGQGEGRREGDAAGSDDESHKITICHIPPGNPENIHSIRIDRSALDAHLAHGDTIGPCGGTRSCTGADFSFDGRASFDPDGLITQWTWEFGDGQADSGSTAVHFYDAPGTYTVRLTVGDSDGLRADTFLTVAFQLICGTEKGGADDADDGHKTETPKRPTEMDRPVGQKIDGPVFDKRTAQWTLTLTLENPDAAERLADLEKLIPEGMKLVKAILPGGDARIFREPATRLVLSDIPIPANGVVVIELILERQLKELEKGESTDAISAALNRNPWTRADEPAIVLQGEKSARRRRVRGQVAGADEQTHVSIIAAGDVAPHKLDELTPADDGTFEPSADLPDTCDEVILLVERPGAYPVFKTLEIADGAVHVVGELEPESVDEAKGASRRVDDPDAEQEIVAGRGGDRARIEIPEDALDREFFVTVREPENMDAIRAAAAASGQRVLTAKEVALVDALTGEEIHSGFSKKIKLGFSVENMQAKESASISHFNPSAGRLDEHLGGELDSERGEIVAEVEHFSIYVALAAAASADLSQLIVYPNPYEERYGTNKIVFENVTANATLTIYTVSGEVVREILNDGPADINGSATGASNAGVIGWDLKNERGRNVASGMYLYILKDPAGNKKTGRVGVVR